MRTNNRFVSRYVIFEKLYTDTVIGFRLIENNGEGNEKNNNDYNYRTLRD